MMNSSFECIEKKKGKRKKKKDFFFFSFMLAKKLSLWLQIKATSHKFLKVSYIWFWSLGRQESNASNSLQFKVETNKMWSFEEKLCKRHAITGLNMVQFSFDYLGLFLGPLVGLNLWLDEDSIVGYFLGLLSKLIQAFFFLMHCDESRIVIHGALFFGKVFLQSATCMDSCLGGLFW